MIIDERTYTCHPGKVKAFLENRILAPASFSPLK